MMKLNKQKKEGIYLIGLIICGIILAWNINTGTSKEKSYEVCDIIQMNAEDFKKLYMNEKWTEEEKEDGRILFADEWKNTMFFFRDGEMSDLILWNHGEEDSEWSVCGIKLGDSFNEVLADLQSDQFIAVEGHNMAMYASGLSLQKRGIELLQIERNDDISYLHVEFDVNKKNLLKEYNFSYSECTYKNEKSILIPYLVIENQSDDKDNQKMNAIIMNEVRNISEMTKEGNADVEITYKISNAESEAFCILWEIKLDEEKVYQSVTFDLLNAGGNLFATDFGTSAEDIALEISEMWFDGKGDVGRIAELQKKNDRNYYVTPLHLVVQYQNSDGKYWQTPMWR